jgi:hypothetical protein
MEQTHCRARPDRINWQPTLDCHQSGSVKIGIIHLSEIVLSFGVPLIGRETKPLCRLVAKDIRIFEKQDPQLLLSFDVALFCREAQPMHCFAKVPSTLVPVRVFFVRCTAFFIHDTEIQLS